MAKAVTLKDKDGNELYPTTSIDMVVGAFAQATFGNTQENYRGYFDLGPLRVQFMNLRKTGLNTGANTYNTWTENWPATFANNYYTVVAGQTSDMNNVAGIDFKVVNRSTTGVSLNINHIGAVSTGTLYYSLIAIGAKP